MKRSVILLFTRDRSFDQVVSDALSEARAVVLIARSVADALQIICQHGRKLACALMDFDNGCRGMTLLSAVHGCYEQLPIVVTMSQDAEHASAVAYANGARTCLSKSLFSALLAATIADVIAPRQQLAAA
jgi:DNA-binding NtrC family response regulator